MIAVKFRPNVDNCPAHGDPNFLSTNSIPNVGFSFAGTRVPPGGTGSSAICTNSATEVNGRFFDLVLQRVRDSSETFDFSISTALVKTSGSLQTGFASYAGNIGTMDWVLLGHYPYKNRQFENNDTISASAAVTVNALTCSIPNVRVAMGNVATGALTGPGARAAPWKNFSIPVENCPPDLNRIRFKLDHLNPMLDRSNHVMAVTGASDSATGVGIQIGHDDGNETILAFSQMHDVTGYSSIQSTGGRFMIALKARYFKPAVVTEVVPGKADASALVTMSYQ
ncbi:fimbrial protein [Herbaspirillum sp. alder98]|uniref:fimbrial protein n=1 Tax=Herbaspirillum sp. alder98 TaxID=2913096 RepID=UPI001CD8C93C|nr:fimbrial protein [Herbaspirillum sp. alder98]MCA1324115.1 type 1 fimbrial protein [Herbaspirillum sp. alder98]